MKSLIVIAATLLAQPPPTATATGGKVSSGQFLEIVRELQRPIHDFEFIFEGKSHIVVADGVPGDRPGGADEQFQGKFSQREDGATLLEMYRNPPNNAPLEHSLWTMVNGEVQVINVIPDLAKRRYPPIMAYAGGFGALHQPHSPEFYVFLSFFRSLKDGDFQYDYLGWENIKGHNCLHVRIDMHPDNPNPNKPTQELWVDVERGGHPLRSKAYRGDDLLRSVEQVRLDKFSLPGGTEVWFPVRAEINMFNYRGEYHRSPAVVEINYVVDGTLRLNQGLKDKDFTLREKGTGAGTDILKRAILKAAKAARREPVRTDPRSIKNRLDEKLAEAQIQARHLDASKSVYQEQRWTSVITLVPALFGCLALGAVLILVLRRR